MIFSNLKFEFRYFFRNKFYVLINTLGLVMGLTLSVYLFASYFHASTFDRHHKNKNEIFLLSMDIMSGNDVRFSIYPPIPVYDALIHEFANVKQASRVYFETKPSVLVHDDIFYEENLYRVDKSFFSMFEIGIVSGNINSLYSKKEAVFVTQRLADKYFNHNQTIGEVITIGKKEYIIEGILENPPTNSSFNYDFISGTHEGDVSSWNSFGSNPIYFQTTSTDDVNSIFENLQARVDKEFGVGEKRLNLIPFREQAGRLDQSSFLTVNDTKYQSLFLLIGILILVISVINYINLSTAQAVTKFKDVALRKINGAYRSQLVFKYLSGPFILTLLSILIAAMLLYFAIPTMNYLSGSMIDIGIFSITEILLASLVILMSITVSAGFYPAWLLSSMSPVGILKSTVLKEGPGAFVRKGLIVIQFCITSALIIFTLALHGQLRFLMNKDMGFKSDYILSLKASDNSMSPTSINKNYAGFKNEVSQLPFVKGVTIGRLPGADMNTEVEYIDHGDTKTASTYILKIDEDFINVMGVSLLDGQNLNSTNLGLCLINQTAAKAFFNGDAIGKKILDFEVAGVTEDFHFLGLYSTLEPLIMRLVPPSRPTFGVIQIKLDDHNLEESIVTIRQIWKKFSPDLAFEYKFLDDHVHTMYEADTKSFQAFSAFSAFAIFISCLGLVGLTSYTLKKRSKEMSIRKIHGATTNVLMRLLLKGFISPVVLAIFISVPFAYYSLSKYLEKFTYRIELTPNFFVVGAVISILIVLVVTGIQSYISSRDNLLKNLHE